ncbi:hypothetical protein TVAG_486290 [Trichomonas vaginalis G3]|uniref:Uncharacterized protein n=1 Tax=Trichomonas vaginalis (strain ATCC PRA-98 / G3) TaxID=412133 RepID=A2EEH6_TRIV3|nr:hypothetical protein TVAGG3_0691040 [Trichomonas vaginalis G3]EAY08982.1 hypothetical protein TVAG_486290 [Trichomonas vaginalis G3]KAI5508569.1 hypothetical protein TVAGG3_0691040 [Trichomonas vaginalis G3]|eukprot:XP_001321205.1 hypothetical protein [Trichomonas vaginalis G3]
MFTQSRSLACKCNNITIDDTEICEAKHTGLSKTEQQEILGRKTPVYHVPMYSVSVLDFGCVKLTKVNEHHIILSCYSCKKSYHLYQSNDNLFIQVSNQIDCNDDTVLSTAQSTEDLIPQSFLPFFKRMTSDDDDYSLFDANEANTNDTPANTIYGVEDDDYDFMFSNTSIPIVGSYVESMNYFVPEIDA